jgi:hypothetical protein
VLVQDALAVGLSHAGQSFRVALSVVNTAGLGLGLVEVDFEATAGVLGVEHTGRGRLDVGDGPFNLDLLQLHLAGGRVFDGHGLADHVA